MSYSHEPVGEYMQGEQIQEVVNFHVHNAMLPAFSIILVVVRDGRIGHLQYPGVGDSHPVCIASDILQYLIDSFSRRAGVNDPVFFEAIMTHFIADDHPFLFESGCKQPHEPSPELAAHGCHGKKEVTLLTPLEMMPCARFIHPTTGHDAVKVRVVEEIGTPCMENGSHTSPEALFEGKGADGSPCRLEHAVVENGLISHGEGMQAGGHSEDDVEVLGRDDLFPSEGNPLFTLLVLALGAMPVPATVVTDLHLAALRTGLYMATKRFSPANRQVSKGLPDRCHYLMRTEKLSSMITDNLSDVIACSHCLGGKSVSINRTCFMRSMSAT